MMEFPYVDPCLNCGGSGYVYHHQHILTWGGEVVRNVVNDRTKCPECEGRGGHIPKGWVDNGSQ